GVAVTYAVIPGSRRRGAPRSDGLILLRKPPIPTLISRPDGRSGDRRKAAGEESPGSIDMRCRITSGGVSRASGRLQGKCHRERTAPRSRKAKRGKGEKVR